MSTPKSWGLFNEDGTPLATGDAWHEWTCPKQQYERSYFLDQWTGEIVDDDIKPVPCPFECVNAKQDKCSKCGVTFKYP